MIQVENINKKYKLYHSNKDRFLGIFFHDFVRVNEHIALDNISFDVKKGEFVSIIGRNGSGKSTLLKILCNVIRPTGGNFYISGNVVSLLELGTGFNGDLTGRENVYNSVTIMNLDINIDSKITQIEEFAEIGEYFDMPIHTYSSGMYVRLAMSLFLHLDPEVFIIDEALSVGDIFFSQKCFTKINELRVKGVTFLFVSHDINTVLTMSDKVLFLKNGKQIYFGDKHEAARLYYGSVDNKQEIARLHSTKIANNLYPLDKNILQGKKQIFHAEGGAINALYVLDENDCHTTHVYMAKSLKFVIGYNIENSLVNPAIAISFLNNKNMLMTVIVYDLKYDKSFIEIEVPFMFEAGEYSLNMNIGSLTGYNTGIFISEYKDLGPITIEFDYYTQKAPIIGLVGLNTRMRFL